MDISVLNDSIYGSSAAGMVTMETTRKEISREREVVGELSEGKSATCSSKKGKKGGEQWC
jgi:hypothetical protein